MTLGAATTDFGPFVQVVITHLVDLFPIKTVMLIELLVLGQYYGLGKLRRYLIQAYPSVLILKRLHFTVLDGAFKHEWSIIYGNVS